MPHNPKRPLSGPWPSSGERRSWRNVLWEILFGACLGIMFGIVFDDLLWGLILGVGFGAVNSFVLERY